MVEKKSKAAKKTKKASSKSTAKNNSKTKGKKSKNENLNADDIGIVIIDDEVTVDKQAELEARKLYLEEARSQEASSD